MPLRVRSDKKRQVKALVYFDVKEMIHRIAHITRTPLKDVGEFLTLFVLDDRATINDLAMYFRRKVQIGNTYYNGNLTVKPIEKKIYGDRELITINFKSSDYDRIAAIAYGLDCTPTRTVAILLEYASNDIEAINEYVFQNMKHELTDGQMKELRKVLTYVNRNNENNSSWLSLLSKIVGDVRPASKRLYDLVNEFLNGK